MESTPAFLTVDQLGEFLRANGFPIKTSTLRVYCVPSVSKGPKPAMRWGRRVLYDPAQALEWARAQLRPIESKEVAA
jgi:hypothetical protein